MQHFFSFIFCNFVATILFFSFFLSFSATILFFFFLFLLFSATWLPQFIHWQSLGKTIISVISLPKFNFLSSLTHCTFSCNFGNTVTEIQSLSLFCQITLNSTYNNNKLYFLQFLAKRLNEEDENEQRKELKREMMKRAERLAICISRLYCYSVLVRWVGWKMGKSRQQEASGKLTCVQLPKM